MLQIKYWLFALLVFLSCPQFALAEEVESIDEKVKDLVHMDGFFDLYWDRQEGQLLLRIDSMGDEFIYQSSFSILG